MYKIVFDVPPRTKILAPPLYTVYTVYLSVITCALQIFIHGGPHSLKVQYHLPNAFYRLMIRLQIKWR